VLGAHPAVHDGQPGVTVRAFLPQAVEALVLPLDGTPAAVPMRRLHPEGFFEAFFAAAQVPFRYRLRAVDAAGHAAELEDPYRFPPLLSEFDLHLITEGTQQRLYEKLGAHVCEVEGLAGVHFAVWAPNAAGVSVVCDANGWDARRHPMRSRGACGVWELFLPGLAEGEKYKYLVRPRRGGKPQDRPQEKSDPVGFYAELRPRTASIVYDLSRYQWNDAEWMARRTARDPLDQPMTIYELHLGSWDRIGKEGNRFLTYRELAAKLIPVVKELGFTHIELLPVMEHPFDASWGYQTVGYFAPTSRFGTPDDFRHLIDSCHQAGLGVILDWVPGHFPNDWHGLMRFDGTALYEHADPRQGQHPDWGTLIFNYGRNEVRGFLLSNALYWLEQYHADGLRVDGVASMLYLDYSRAPGEWIPNQYGGRENLEAIDFLKQFNTLVHQRPGVFTVAEESTAWPGVSRPAHLGGLGFTFKWNMGWMHDLLEYMSKDPIYRKHHHNLLTFVMLYAFHENFILPLSHDEVVHGKGSLRNKMPGDEWQRFANLRLLYGYMYGQPGKKLLFMGAEFGQGSEWNPQGFEWIDFHDWEQSIVSFLRRARNPDDFVVVACNFTPTPRQGYLVGVPESGHYSELFNSDSEYYGGSNLGNSGGVQAQPWPSHGRPYSLRLTLPPLAVVILKKQ